MKPPREMPYTACTMPLSSNYPAPRCKISTLTTLCFAAQVLVPHQNIVRFKQARQSTRRMRATSQQQTYIHSLKNQRIKDTRALLRRRQREREGKILLEGQRLISDAIHAGALPLDFFCTREALERSESVRALRADITSAGSREFIVTESVIESFSDTSTPQGLVAVFQRPLCNLPALSTLTLVCDDIRDPGNLGTLLRSAAGAGVQAVALTAGCADVWSLKALRAGMGAQFRLPSQSNMTWTQIQDYIQVSGGRIRVAEGTSSTLYTNVDWSVPCALIIGSEAAGPSEEAFNAADEKIAIPLEAGVESLNAAMAGAVILFEASRQRRGK